MPAENLTPPIYIPQRLTGKTQRCCCAHAKLPSNYCLTIAWCRCATGEHFQNPCTQCYTFKPLHPFANQYLNLAKMTYDVLQGLFSSQTQYFLCYPPAEVMHLLLSESEVHISAVEVNVFEHEHAAVPSIHLQRKVFDTFLLP